MSTQEKIEKKKQEMLQAIREEIEACYEGGNETADLWFDASEFLAYYKPLPKKVEDLLKLYDAKTDGWYRGVFTLRKEEALKLAEEIAEWNDEWSFAITHQDEDYNSFNIRFGPTNGTEHTIEIMTPNGHGYWDAWQRNVAE